MKRMRIDRSEVLRIQEKSKRIGREYKPSILHYYKERNKQERKINHENVRNERANFQRDYKCSEELQRKPPI